jgi:hypothetical protein
MFLTFVFSGGLARLRKRKMRQPGKPGPTASRLIVILPDSGRRQ